MIGLTADGHITLVNVDFTKAMSEIAKLMQDSVRRNFGDGGRPARWKNLKTGGQSFLFRNGALLRAVHRTSDKVSATVYVNELPYRFIHQFGGWAGRGHRSYIPARPYMMFQDGDVETYQKMIGDNAVTAGQSIKMDDEAFNVGYEPTSII